MVRRTYVLRDGVLVPKELAKPRPVAPYVIDDIKPYQSMIDGHMVTGGRREHRNHLREHGCIEVGSEDPRKHVRPKEMPRAHQDIKRAIEEVQRAQRKRN